MKSIYKNKRVLVVGLSHRSGLSAVRLLFYAGANIYVSDNKEYDEIKNIFEDVKPMVSRYYFGQQLKNQLDGIDMIILSPGVPRTIPLIKEASIRNIPIKSEIELGSDFYNGKIIAITGTDGKSTTSALIEAILKTQYKTFLGGNIGHAFTDIILNNIEEDLTNTIAVLEMSSFQLESLIDFHANISVFTNFTADHLNRYETMDDYFKAKLNIFKNQSANDFAILNYDYDILRKAMKSTKAKIIYFSARQHVNGAYIEDNNIKFQDTIISPINSLSLKGRHNLENILAAVSVAYIVGIDSKNIAEVLKTFQGLEHRNELVAQVGDIIFINDSKGTTINAVKNTLLSYDGDIVLIAGGRAKGDDFSKLSEIFNKRVKHLVLLGEAADDIAIAVKHQSIIFAESMNRAVEISINLISKGYVILSPACASYDMYPDFEARGRDFKRIVKEVIKKIA